MGNANTAQFQPALCYDKIATISSGQTVSDEMELRGTYLVAMILPSTFDGTTMTFKGSIDGTNFFDMYNAGGVQMTSTVAASRWIPFSPQDFAGCNFIKLVAGTAQSTTDTLIQLITRPLA